MYGLPTKQKASHWTIYRASDWINIDRLLNIRLMIGPLNRHLIGWCVEISTQAIPRYSNQDEY